MEGRAAGGAGPLPSITPSFAFLKTREGGGRVRRWLMKSRAIGDDRPLGSKLWTKRAHFLAKLLN